MNVLCFENDKMNEKEQQKGRIEGGKEGIKVYVLPFLVVVSTDIDIVF